MLPQHVGFAKLVAVAKFNATIGGADELIIQGLLIGLYSERHHSHPSHIHSDARVGEAKKGGAVAGDAIEVRYSAWLWQAGAIGPVCDGDILSDTSKSFHRMHRNSIAISRTRKHFASKSAKAPSSKAGIKVGTRACVDTMMSVDSVVFRRSWHEEECKAHFSHPIFVGIWCCRCAWTCSRQYVC